MLSTLLADVRYSLRGFVRRPGFAVVIVLTLAFGIGVNVAVFSMYDGLLLKKLPAPDAGRLVNLQAPGPKPGATSCNLSGPCAVTFSYPMFRDLERVDGPFAGVAAHRLIQANLGYDQETTSAQGALVSGSYFRVLGLAPALGRLLGPDDDKTDGEANVVVLGYDYWQSDLGGDASVIGKALVVNGKPLTIVGVAPRDFTGTTVGAKPRVYVPITFRWLSSSRSLPNHDDRRRYWVYAFARLKPGVTLEQARGAIAPVYRAILNDVEAPLQSGMSDQTLAAFRAKTLVVAPGARGQSSMHTDLAQPLALLLGATAVVLLIACVNIANLMLARGTARVGEIAIRSSLGAAPYRLLTLLSVEALALAAVAALGSLPVALATLHGIATVVPNSVDNDAALRLDGTAASLAFGIAALCALVFGVVPALKLSRTPPARALQSSGASRAIGGKGAARFRHSLTTGQIALSMMLLVLAALFTQSVGNLTHVDTGMRTESVLAFGVSPELNGYTAEESERLFDRLADDIAAQPGVTSVAASMMPLLTFSESNWDFAIEGIERNPDVLTSARTNMVAPAFLRTLGVAVLAGRDLTDADSADRPKVALVSREFARHYGLGEAPVGKHIGMSEEPGDDDLDIEIVGVIPDIAYSNLKDGPQPQVLVPRKQAPPSGFATFYVRTAQNPDDAFAMLRNAVASIDPNLPATNLKTFQKQIDDNAALDRLIATLAAALAAGATLLAALGLYGMLSYSIAQRTRELALRLALGAEESRVRGMVLRQVGWMAGIGVPIGLVAAIGLGRAASALLFGLKATDPQSLAAALVVLSVVVLGASYLPARRASRVQPVTALRSE